MPKAEDQRVSPELLSIFAEVGTLNRAQFRTSSGETAGRATASHDHPHRTHFLHLEHPSLSPPDMLEGSHNLQLIHLVTLLVHTLV